MREKTVPSLVNVDRILTANRSDCDTFTWFKYRMTNDDPRCTEAEGRDWQTWRVKETPEEINYLCNPKPLFS